MMPKIGTRYYSTTCTAELIVVRSSGRDVRLTCGGEPMATEPTAGAPEVPADAQGVLLGKRYENDEAGLEVLVTKAGAGPLEVDGAPLVQKDAKRLPASD